MFTSILSGPPCFRKYASDANQSQQNDAIRFIVHGVPIGAPLRTATGGLSRLKPLLAQRVKGQLEDPNSEFYIEKLCGCKTDRNKVKPLTEKVAREELDDEKEDEFAILGMLELSEVDGILEGTGDSDNLEEDNQEQEQEQKPGQQAAEEHPKNVHEHKLDVDPVLDTLEPMEVDYEPGTDEEEDIYFEELVERMLFG